MPNPYRSPGEKKTFDRAQWLHYADSLIAEYATADDSHAELMELLTANEVPSDIAKFVVDDMRPDDA